MKKKLISLLFIIGLLISLFVTLILVSKRQDIRKRAGASEVKLSLYPATENIPIGSTKTFDLIATFTGGSSTEKLDYLKTEISFSKEYLKVPADKYVMTDFPNQTNFDKIFRVDGPQAANDSGRIVIELGATTKGSGPPTDKPLTVGRIYFEGVKQTPSAQSLTIGTTEVINNLSAAIPSAFSESRYTVGGGIPTYTPTPTITPGGPSLTPSPTSTPGPSPTPGGTIEIGNKDSLVINIGGGTDPNIPYLRFKTKLFGIEKTPEIKVRLKVVDLVVQLTPAPAPYNSCQSPGKGEYYYEDILMIADPNGIYRPKEGASFTSYGSSELFTTSDGWIPLKDITPGRIYSVSVKGPKHRNVEMLDNFKLEKGNPLSQDFDWTSKLLEPGDLPNPNDAGKQDCVVNSIDLSLIIDRIGKIADVDLRVADVNYDGVINGNDVSKVVNTLSTKPDDDL